MTLVSRSRRRGFTLIELMTALAMTLVVSAAALGVLLTVVHTQREAAVRNQLHRDAQLVIDLLSYDLAFAGAGVPRGSRARAFSGSASPADESQLRPFIRIGKPDNLVFVGDLPFPNAELSGVVGLVNVASGSSHRVQVTSELSPCAPYLGDETRRFTCNNSSAYSLVRRPDYPSTLSGTSSHDCAKTNDTTMRRSACPWGLNKWQVHLPNQSCSGSRPVAFLTFVTPKERWFERAWAIRGNDGEGGYDDESFNGEGGLHLCHFSPGLGDTSENMPSGDFTAAKAALGYISHIDRVFWSLEGTTAGTACTTPGSCVLKRRQCWGRIGDPGEAAWPKVRDTPFRSNATPLHCQVNGSNVQGTGWQTVMEGIGSLTFRYYEDFETEIDPGEEWDLEAAANVEMVEVHVVMSRKAPGSDRQITHEVRRRFYLENWGGIVDVPDESPASCKKKKDKGKKCKRK